MPTSVVFNREAELYFVSHFSFICNTEYGVSSPEKLWIFPGRIHVGQHSHNFPFPVIEMLDRFMVRLQLEF